MKPARWRRSVPNSALETAGVSEQAAATGLPGRLIRRDGNAAAAAVAVVAAHGARLAQEVGHKRACTKQWVLDRMLQQC